MRTARGPPQRRCHAGAELGARIPSVTTATGVETAAVALRRAAPQPRGDPVLSTDTAGSSTPVPGPVPRASLAPITAARRDLPPPDLPFSRFPIAQRPPGPRSHLLFTFQTTAVSADARRMRSQLRDPPAPLPPPPLAPPGASARGSAQAAAKAHCSPTQLRGGGSQPPPTPRCTLYFPQCSIYSFTCPALSPWTRSPSQHRCPHLPPPTSPQNKAAGGAASPSRAALSPTAPTHSHVLPFPKALLTPTAPPPHTPTMPSSE